MQYKHSEYKLWLRQLVRIGNSKKRQLRKRDRITNERFLSLELTNLNWCLRLEVEVLQQWQSDKIPLFSFLVNKGVDYFEYETEQKIIASFPYHWGKLLMPVSDYWCRSFCLESSSSFIVQYSCIEIIFFKMVISIYINVKILVLNLYAPHSLNRLKISTTIHKVCRSCSFKYL